MSRTSRLANWMTVLAGNGMAAFALGNMHYATSRPQVFIKILVVWAGLMIASLSLYQLLSTKGPAS